MARQPEVSASRRWASQGPCGLRVRAGEGILHRGAAARAGVDGKAGRLVEDDEAGVAEQLGQDGQGKPGVALRLLTHHAGGFHAARRIMPFAGRCISPWNRISRCRTNAAIAAFAARRRGGGGYAINIAADATTLTVRGQDAVAVYHAKMRAPGKRTSTSTGQRHFCRLCGSALWLFSPEWPELTHPFASAIDTPLPVPDAVTHVMLAYKPDWVVVQRTRGGYLLRGISRGKHCRLAQAPS